MPDYRNGLPPRPPRLLDRPLSDKGYPVPWFVEYIDGVPDFRVMSAAKWARAVRARLCWICGQPLGKHLAFVAGPMCGVSRSSAEPPCHLDCARYAVQACPFLLLPNAHRREAHLPEGVTVLPGHTARNPGVAMLWLTDSYRTFVVPDWIDVPNWLAKLSGGPIAVRQGARLIEMGPPHVVEWWSEGRAASREAVKASIDDGLPKLLALAKQDGSELELAARVTVLLKWLPINGTDPTAAWVDECV